MCCDQDSQFGKTEISNRRYDLLVERLREGIAVVDTDENVTFSNPAAEYIFGVRPGQLVGHNLREFVDDAAWQILKEQTKLRREGAATSYELAIIRPDGEQRILIMSVSPELNGDANFTESFGLIQDITETKRITAVLTESEERFDFALSVAASGMWDYDLRTDITYYDARYYTMAGYEPDEFPGTFQQWQQLVHEDDFEQAHSAVVAHIDEKTPAYDAEFRFRRKSGDWMWIHARGKIVSWDEQGTPLRMIGIHSDITERKRAEDALRKSEANLAMAQGVAHIGNWEYDRRTKERRWSAEMFRIFGLEPAAVPPTHETETSLVHADDREIFNRASIKLSATTNETSVEYRIIRPDGQERFVLDMLKGISDKAGNVIKLFGVVQDITERKQAELERLNLEQQLRQSQKMEAIGTLAGGIAHDFNNILFAILGNADLASAKIPPDSPANRYLQEVIISSHRASDLVKQILTFARQAEKKLVLLQASYIAKEVFKLLRATMPSTITISLRLATDRTTIVADPTEIHQVIMNLSTNAHQAMLHSGGELEIGLSELVVDEIVRVQHPELQTGDYLVLSVSDTGPGIPPEDRQRIFEPFFTTKDVGEGTGIGLAVVHGIVKDLKGIVSVYSEVGAGTVFKVFIPLADAGPSNEIAESAVMPRGSERVLVVDDEPMLAKLIAGLLEDLGYAAEAFTDSENALRTYLDSPGHYDLIITDQTMPKLTGFELASRVFEHHPEQPIILCTGFSQTMPREKAEEIGISAYVFKPISQRGLAETIRQVLD